VFWGWRLHVYFLRLGVQWHKGRGGETLKGYGTHFYNSIDNFSVTLFTIFDQLAHTPGRTFISSRLIYLLTWRSDFSANNFKPATCAAKSIDYWWTDQVYNCSITFVYVDSHDFATVISSIARFSRFAGNVSCQMFYEIPNNRLVNADLQNIEICFCLGTLTNPPCQTNICLTFYPSLKAFA